MNARKHTPGPWLIEAENCHSGDIATVHNTRDRWVTIYAPDWMNTGLHEDEQSANATLIAAAPDLLEALIEITDDYADRFDLDCPSTNPGIKSVVLQARAAITKATGEPT